MTSPATEHGTRTRLRASVLFAAIALGAAACGSSVSAETEPVEIGADDGSTETTGTSTEAAAPPADSALVSLVGDLVPPHPDGISISLDPSTDSAIGMVAPTISGTSFTGETVEISPGGGPTILLFVAHWCPHCQEEIPQVQALIDSESLPEGVRVVAISTSVRDDASNYPPVDWFTDEHWSSPIMRDDDNATALSSFGGTAFPYAVFLDADNVMVARSLGSVGSTQFVQLAERTVSQ